MDADRLAVMIPAILVFVGIGISLWWVLFNPKMREQRKRHAEQLNHFQTMACLSLQEQYQHQGRLIKFRAVTEKNGEVKYLATALDGLPLPEKCTPDNQPA